MLSNIHKLLMATYCSLLCSFAFAATPVSTVNIAIESNQADQVAPLLTKGLSKVLTRLTGNTQIAQQDSVAELLKDPTIFLERYTQQDSPPSLKIEFDQSAIQQALNKAGVPTWTDKKPTLMVWWLTARGDTYSLMADSQANSDIIQQAAATQGFTVTLPIADLDELGLADPASFDADKPTAIFKASEKYNTNAILAVKANQLASDKWQLQWRLWLTNSTQLLAKGEIEGASLVEVTANLLAATNPPLANVYLVKAKETKKLEVTIKNVDFTRYVQVSALMSSFNARLLETNGSIVRYELEADPTQLKAQLELIHFYQEPADENAHQLVFKPQ